MATTKASRKAKRQSYSRGSDTDQSFQTLKARKAHKSKEAITKGAVKKSDGKVKETREYILKKRDKPIAHNGRKPGRQLIRWNVCTDQILLLVMEYELKRHGITIPFDSIAKRLASEKDTTGACVQQHLTKLRKEMLARGSWVPPLVGKPCNRSLLPDIRGYVMDVTRKGVYEPRELSWSEDAFKFVDLVHINQSKSSMVNKPSDNGDESSGLAHRLVKTTRSAEDLPDEEDDPADLPSDEEFHPSNKKSKKAKRSKRASAKFGRNSTYCADSDADADGESDPEVVIKREGLGRPVMMALYQSEVDKDAGIVTFELPSHWLAEYPGGVNRAYRHSHGIKVGETDENGVEVFSDDESDSDLGHHEDLKKPQRYYQTFEGSDDGVNNMDESDSDIYIPGFECHQDNVTMKNANPYIAQSSDQMPRFGSNFPNTFESAVHPGENYQCNNTSTFSPGNSEQTHHENFIGMNNPAPNSFVQTAYGHNDVAPDAVEYNGFDQSYHGINPNAMGRNTLNQSRNFVGSNTMGNNALNQNYFDPGVHSQGPPSNGPLNRAGTNTPYDGKTFAEIMTERQALARARNAAPMLDISTDSGFVMGDTTSAANDPSVSNVGIFDNPVVGTTQNEIDYSNWVPVNTVDGYSYDQNSASFPMNDPVFNSSHDQNDEQGYSQDLSQAEDWMENYSGLWDAENDPSYNG